MSPATTAIAYLAAFDVLFAVVATWEVRRARAGRQTRRVLAGAAAIAGLVNGSLFLCPPAVVAKLVLFGGLGLGALALSLFAKPEPLLVDRELTVREKNAVFFRALIPGVLLIGPLIVMGFTVIGLNHRESVGAEPLWANFAEAIGFGVLYAFAVYEKRTHADQ